MTAAVPRVYLDWNASAPLRPEAREAMLAALAECGNPSSIHAEGRRARASIDRARDEVAALVGVEPHTVTFTSGATEAAAHALTPEWRGGRMGRLYLSALEHPCVLSGGRFAPEAVLRLPVTSAGTIDIPALKQVLDRHDRSTGRPLVALQAANNETGIVQPVAEAAALTHAAGGLLICDAVQMAGRVRTNIAELGADALLLSAHKLGGPKGAGALILAREAEAPVPLLTGGGQEQRQRAGTEAVAAIAGFGAAARAAREGLDGMPHVAAVRDRLEAGASRVLADASSVKSGAGSVFLGTSGYSIVNARLPNTSVLVMAGVSAQLLVMQLDLAGFAVSAGAACSSGKVTRSPVLQAMGVPEAVAAGAVRVSIGHTTTAEEIDRFIDAWAAIVAARAAREAA